MARSRRQQRGCCNRSAQPSKPATGRRNPQRNKFRSDVSEFSGRPARPPFVFAALSLSARRPISPITRFPVPPSQDITKVHAHVVLRGTEASFPLQCSFTKNWQPAPEQPSPSRSPPPAALSVKRWHSIYPCPATW